MSIVESGKATEVLACVDAKKVRTAIDQCSKSMARKVLVAAGLPADLFKRVEQEYDTANFDKNWGI